MFIKRKNPWEGPSMRVTPEEVYIERRRFIKSMAGYGLMAGVFLSGAGGIINPSALFAMGKKPPLITVPETPTSMLYPAKRNRRFRVKRALTEEKIAAAYNNFYEFSTNKKVWKYVEGFKARPWTVEVTGLVKRPKVYDLDELVKKIGVEERVYRFRCVEAWAMTVPWTGLPMRKFLNLVEPMAGAKYIRFRTLYDKEVFPQQKLRFWLPWPYEEGLTIEEAGNVLTLLATGIYGHELPAQHGSPIRLVIPWKYGFKSIKSIVRIEFTETRPETFWNTLAPEEYGFQSNVDPAVPHPRWSQATEKLIGTGMRVPTLKYNGYGEYVKGLYEG